MPNDQRLDEYRVGTFVRLTLRINRQQLFASWNALKNLVDKAGNIQMKVEAERVEGFDRSWLQNAVIEPLEEADIHVEEE